MTRHYLPGFLFSVVAVSSLLVYFGIEDNRKIAECIDSGKSIEFCHLTVKGR